MLLFFDGGSVGVQPGLLSVFLLVSPQTIAMQTHCRCISNINQCVEVTESELCLQGHALMTRHSGSANPCPFIDFDAGFNAWMAYAYGLPKGTTVADKFGKPFGKAHTPPPPPPPAPLHW